MLEKLFYGFCMSLVALVVGAVIFCAIDESLGTTQTYRENFTVTDTYIKRIPCGKTIITKYYLTVKTETGTEDISVTHDLYKKVEINNDIEITITVTETKLTKKAIVKYSSG